MFLTGPKVVKEALGEEASAESLGGASVHERNGVCHFVVEDDADSVCRVREILDYLPSNASSPAPQRMVVEPSDPDPSPVVPTEHRQVYDVRDVIRALADGGELLEPSARWARNVVTALCRLNGRTVGVLANQPKYLGGTLDSESASKAARFVRLCNAFGLPLVVLVDTPGFMPGSRQERGGVIRHGAKLLHAFAESRSPRVTVVLRKAFGGAYISMNARDLGADFTFAWPQAEIGVMAASQAVGIIHRRKLDELEQDADAERAELATGYAEEHLRAGVAAHDGFIDEVIEPAQTRTRLIWALDALANRRSGGGVKNIPL
jgi:acetyl-CoA carboxylase carboxyltransferase component